MEQEAHMRRTREELYQLAVESERRFQEAEAKRKKEADQEVETFNEHVKARTYKDWEDWVLLKPSRQRCSRTSAP